MNEILEIESEFSERERAFAYKYLETYDHIRAAEELGLASTSGFALLRKVSPLVSALQREMAAVNILTEDFVRSQYLQLIPKLSGEVEVPVRLGNTVSNEKLFFASELVSALREVGKSTKFYEEGSGNASVQVNLNFDSVMGSVEITGED